MMLLPPIPAGNSSEKSATDSLRFRADGCFTIAQLTDIHWHDDRESQLRTRSLIERVLDCERPDLVVLTGDVIDGSRCGDPAVSWREAVHAIDARAIPWATVLGNHDDEGSLTRRALMAIDQTCPWSRSESGPADLPGVGNYVLAIEGSQSSQPRAVLYFLDSRGYVASDPECRYAGISVEQVNWFRSLSRGVEMRWGAAGLVGLVFFHMPLDEYAAAFESGLVHGQMREPVCGAPENSGLFGAIREVRHVAGAFAGHDHLNDFEASLEGVRLCYGRVSGYGGYGREDVMAGARIIQLREGSADFDTWLRLDDGTISKRA